MRVSLEPDGCKPSVMEEQTNVIPNRRAGQVCERCHAKKIKCDLQLQTMHDGQRCRNCVRADSTCQLRSSRRGKKRRCLPPPEPRDNAECPPEESLAEINNVPMSPINASPHSPGYRRNIEPSYAHPVSPDASSDQASYMSQVSLLASQTVPYDHAYDPTLLGQFELVAAPDQAMITPSRESSPQRHQRRATFLGDTGYLQVFSTDQVSDETVPANLLLGEANGAIDTITPELLECYVESYFEYIHIWCPILDRETLEMQPDPFSSLLFRHSLAICGTQIQPPLIPHTDSLDHYRRAKALFYNDNELDPLMRIYSVMLFNWWGPGPPNTVNLDTTWWWTGVAIRLAQEIGLHREPLPGQVLRPGETLGLRRRVWWTLFARDRLISLAKGRPCVIDQEFCTLEMVSLDDFTDATSLKAAVFIQWVRLWDIVGRIYKELCRKNRSISKELLARELINWVQSLPIPLQLPFSERTTRFNRDVHELHLGYFTAIIVFHLSKAEGFLPRAPITAMAGASCIARIFKDFLTRGSLRFLASHTMWYIIVAILALLHARRIPYLKQHAEADIFTLRSALKQLTELWHTGPMYEKKIERLLEREGCPPYSSMYNANEITTATVADDVASFDSQWIDYLPFVTIQTSPLIGALLVDEYMSGSVPDLELPIDTIPELDVFFRGDGFSLSGW